MTVASGHGFFRSFSRGLARFGHAQARDEKFAFKSTHQRGIGQLELHLEGWRRLEGAWEQAPQRGKGECGRVPSDCARPLQLGDGQAAVIRRPGSERQAQCRPSGARGGRRAVAAAVGAHRRYQGRRRGRADGRHGRVPPGMRAEVEAMRARLVDVEHHLIRMVPVAANPMSFSGARPPCPARMRFSLDRFGALRRVRSVSATAGRLLKPRHLWNRDLRGGRLTRPRLRSSADTGWASSARGASGIPSGRAP